MSFNSYIPPAGFYFDVKLDGGSVGTSFQEVSGIDVSVDLETISEAGLNEFVHKVPKKTQYNNLVLKRGLLTEDSALGAWLNRCIQDGLYWSVNPRDIRVTLLYEDGSEAMAWNFVRAFPVKWAVSGFNSQESAFAMETIELSYAFWTFAK